jgi:hypothetical protein
MHAYVCRNGSDARGYFVWSFLDVFEFLFAYKMRFGLCGVDMNAGARTRYVRSSARWYAGFLRGGELRPPPAAAPDDDVRPYTVRRDGHPQATTTTAHYDGRWEII